MRAFAAIAAVATLAFSAVTSAFPSPASTVADVANAAPNGITVAATVDVLKVDLDHVLNANDLHLPTGGSHSGPKGIPDVLIDINAQVLPLIKDLNVKITADVDAHVALDLAVKVFAQIGGIVHGACNEIKDIVAADISVALHLNGAVIDVHVCAQILAQLLNAIVLAVALVVKVGVHIDVTALLKIVANIGLDLSVIVGAVVGVAADVAVDLRGLLSVIVNICVDLKLTALVKVFVNLLGINIDLDISL